MRMRSALTTSVLAVGILLGGAGAALANDGGGIVNATGSQGAEQTSDTTFAGVIDRVGPVYFSNSETGREWNKGTIQAIFG
ncbi:hypothetical protein OG413_42750 [Streptomyces sp. NBC_01433]|uniref:hypothetical protein n=1 Tax=Streptomyces sp. NBC_01433 TaxID=2903864 RepID=UPI00225181C6|nr:hypothetical protein [Streptomyces sp. NBC_01433]MCX4681920.1 hypothetical protein [Streptomyces sp. NBC_01433]